MRDGGAAISQANGARHSVCRSGGGVCLPRSPAGLVSASRPDLVIIDNAERDKSPKVRKVVEADGAALPPTLTP